MTGAWHIAIITEAAAWNHRAHGTTKDALEAAIDLLDRHEEEGITEIMIALEEPDEEGELA